MLLTMKKQNNYRAKIYIFIFLGSLSILFAMYYATQEIIDGFACYNWKKAEATILSVEKKL